MGRSVCFILFTAILYMACTNGRQKATDRVAAYYSAQSIKNFNLVQNLMADSLTIVEGDFIMPYDKESFKAVFQWDSIFGTDYEVRELQQDGEDVLVTVAGSSCRYRFLGNDPLVLQHRVSFENHKISKIVTVKDLGADWQLWNTRINALEAWVAVHRQIWMDSGIG